MSSDAPSSKTVTPTDVPIDPEIAPEVDPNLQVRFKSEEGRLLLFLPPETNRDNSDSPTGAIWTELWQQLKHRLNGGEHAWIPNTEVHLIADNRLLDLRQLQEIAQALTEAKLQLKCVKTTRRQTAIAAATAGYSVNQDSEHTRLNGETSERVSPQADPLYLKMTLRSGVDIRHPGTVVVLGDVNPGSSVIADGDIIIWGRLRGTVHAGASGNAKSSIMALQMEPTLIRIADKVARGPETPPAQFYPEVAYITSGGIRISRAGEYAKIRSLEMK